MSDHTSAFFLGTLTFGGHKWDLAVIQKWQDSEFHQFSLITCQSEDVPDESVPTTEQIRDLLVHGQGHHQEVWALVQGLCVVNSGSKEHEKQSKQCRIQYVAETKKFFLWPYEEPELKVLN